MPPTGRQVETAAAVAPVLKACQEPAVGYQEQRKFAFAEAATFWMASAANSVS